MRINLTSSRGTFSWTWGRRNSQKAAIPKQLPDHILNDDRIRELLSEQYRRGFQEGCLDAERRLRETAEEKIKEERERVDQFVQGMHAQFQQLYQKGEQAVIRFSIAIAKQIIKREIQLDPEVILIQIREAMKRVLGVDKIRLRINPEDEHLVRHNRQAILAGADSIRDMVVETDDQMERGSCIIESESGNVDSRFSTQIKKIEEALSNPSL